MGIVAGYFVGISLGVPICFNVDKSLRLSLRCQDGDDGGTLWAAR